MARGKRKPSAAVNRAAEALGHALGSVAGTVDSLQAQHPHPVDEAREALAAGQETLSDVASKVGTRAAAIIKKAKAVVRQTKKVATRVRRKKRPAIARATGTARKVAKRATKRVNHRQKARGRSARRPKR